MLTRRSLIQSAAALSASVGSSLAIPGFVRQSAAQAGKKSLVFASIGPVTGNWDPTSHTVLGQTTFEYFIYSHLVRCPTEEGKRDEILPDLATSWRLIDEHTLEYTLRQGVKFHDGSDFTAEDVKATMTYASDPKRPGSVFYPGRVDVEVVNPYLVRLHTEKYGYPASAFLFVASFFPMLSAKDIADSSMLEKRPNGTGPFKYVSTNGDRNYAAANKEYYGGAPKIDEIVYTYVADVNTRVLGLLNGAYHVAQRIEPDQYHSLQGNPKLSLTKTLSAENKYLHFRCNKPPFNDLRVRMAACNAIDRSQILTLMGDAAVASDCYVSPVKFGYVELNDYPKFDPEACQRLLAEAGFPKGQGLPELEYITSIGFYPKTKEYGELIVAMMAEQNFNVKLTVLEAAAWEQAIYRRADGQGAGHMCDVGWMSSSPEPDLVLRPNFHSKAALINGISDPDLDAVLDKERNEFHTDLRLKILREETLPMIAKKVPSLSLFSAVNFSAAVSNLKGANFYPNAMVDFSQAELI